MRGRAGGTTRAVLDFSQSDNAPSPLLRHRAPHAESAQDRGVAAPERRDNDELTGDH
ncbi:hypothetical protein GCM10010496_48470 [Streptomyces asoensis]|nr:hypothetical protein GCM10010496_48470 [Streptomyces asoensis]